MKICFKSCREEDVNSLSCECHNQFINKIFMEQYKKTKSLIDLSKIDTSRFHVELHNKDVVKIKKVFIDGKDAFVLLDNGKYYNFLPDEEMLVIERPSSSCIDFI